MSVVGPSVETIVVSETICEVNGIEPCEPSASFQLIKHSPAENGVVRATETVLLSAPSCGSAIPTNSLLHTTVRPILPISAIESRNTIWICGGCTCTIWLRIGLDVVTSFVPAAPLAIAPSALKPLRNMNEAIANPIIEAIRLAIKHGSCAEVIIGLIQR